MNKPNSNKLQLLYYLKSFSHTKGLTTLNCVSCGSWGVWIDKMAVIVCEQLATTFNTTVYHHRTFTYGVGISERKNITFNP